MLMFSKLATRIAMSIFLLILISCTSFNQERSENAIERYVKVNLLDPASFEVRRYYPPVRLKITKEDADAANELHGISSTKPFDGWARAIDMKAMSSYGDTAEQSATFYFNAACDSVTSTDLAPFFLKDSIREKLLVR
ncbi:MAG TPA: hypothetical protein VFR58_04920 [Flavisolibacter sp.]|nr:hypothetical protein [Flavisolibacter sp.]